MKVFVTGASGFIGQAVVKELLAHGHSVLGMTRSDDGAAVLQALGAEPYRATIEETDKVVQGVRQADGVIHLAFNHDFSRFMQNCEEDRDLTLAMSAALEGTRKPMLTTSGILIADVPAGTVADETAPAKPVSSNPRAASEEAVMAAAAKGVNISVVRLPQVHDPRRQGLITYALMMAREKGELAYVGEGKNRIAAAHLSDVAQVYRLALEKGEAGAVWHAVGEPGVAVKAIMETLSQRTGLPLRSIPADEAGTYFGWMNMFSSSNLVASSELTQQRLGWRPGGPDLLSDLAQLVE